MKSKTKKQISVTTIALAVAAASPAFAADTHVKGYTKKKGSYVAPHQQTAPDKSKANNYSTKGNTNPHTGKKGTVDPDKKK